MIKIKNKTQPTQFYRERIMSGRSNFPLCRVTGLEEEEAAADAIHLRQSLWCSPAWPAHKQGREMQSERKPQVKLKCKLVPGAKPAVLRRWGEPAERGWLEPVPGGLPAFSLQQWWACQNAGVTPGWIPKATGDPQPPGRCSTATSVPRELPGQQRCWEGKSTWEVTDAAACKRSGGTCAAGETLGLGGSSTGSLESCSKRRVLGWLRPALLSPAQPRQPP